MAKIKPPLFNKQYNISSHVAWKEVERAGLLSLLELPRDEQVQIIQYKYAWFTPKAQVKSKDSKYTKEWWDTLTGDQQTVRWALAFPTRCRKDSEEVLPKPLPKVGFYDTVSEQNALSWYADIPPHLRKSVESEIEKAPSVLDVKKTDELYQVVADDWGDRPELPEAREDGLRGDEDFVIEVWCEWARMYTELLTLDVIVKMAPRIQAERKMLSQALGLADGGNGFPAQSDGLDDTQAATVRWIQSQGETPLEFLLSTYKDTEAKMSDRITAARTLMEYVHKRIPAKQEIETKDLTEPKLDAKLLKGLSAKDLALLEQLLAKMGKA